MLIFNIVINYQVQFGFGISGAGKQALTFVQAFSLGFLSI
jgi:hypothetical protein